MNNEDPTPRAFAIKDNNGLRYHTRPPFALSCAGTGAGWSADLGKTLRPTASYSTREAAELAGQRWVEEGITPSQQGDEANRAEMAKRFGVGA